MAASRIRKLFDFAQVVKDDADSLTPSPWQILAEEHAQKEDWNYRRKPDQVNRYPILFSYIRYTFKRLWEEGKVLEAESAACFNTGLVTKYYQQIYAYFVPHRYSESRKWWLQGFYPESDTRLLQSFATLPERARYFDDPGALVYDTRLKLVPDLEHIIEQRRERFLERYKRQPGDTDKDDQAKCAKLRRDLDGAINESLKRVACNYKIAIPQYYWPGGEDAEGGSLQLLLPVCLDDPLRADCALPVRREGGVYKASTVLPLDVAFKNARLIAKPDPEWLIP